MEIENKEVDLYNKLHLEYVEFIQIVFDEDFDLDKLREFLSDRFMNSTKRLKDLMKKEAKDKKEIPKTLYI